MARSSSRAYVQFEGGTPEQQRQVQDALDKRINSNTWMGHVDVHRRWAGSGWRVAQARASAPGIGMGPALPEIPEPWDATERIVEILREDGIPVAGFGLEADKGQLLLPSPLPDMPEGMLDLMDDASTRAAAGTGTGAPTFDQNMRVFQQLRVRFDFVVAREHWNSNKELGRSHKELEHVTGRLRSATIWLLVATAFLVVATVFLAAVTARHG